MISRTWKFNCFWIDFPHIEREREWSDTIFLFFFCICVCKPLNYIFRGIIHVQGFYIHIYLLKMYIIDFDIFKVQKDLNLFNVLVHIKLLNAEYNTDLLCVISLLFTIWLCNKTKTDVDGTRIFQRHSIQMKLYIYSIQLENSVTYIFHLSYDFIQMLRNTFQFQQWHSM